MNYDYNVRKSINRRITYINFGNDSEDHYIELRLDNTVDRSLYKSLYVQICM